MYPAYDRQVALNVAKTVAAIIAVAIAPSSSSSGGGRNKYYLGGIIALLLQDHCTMSTKSVCSNQYMVTDQHWATGAQIKHSTLSVRIREWRPEQNGLIWFNKRTHPNEYRNGHQLSTKWALARPVALGSDQSSVSRMRQGGVPEGAVH